MLGDDTGGDLLEGFYDDWIIRRRERLRNLYFRAQDALMQGAVARGFWQEALFVGHRILYEDPLRESIHREVIRLHLRQGQRVQALRQYQRCVRILMDELGVEPMEETRALHDGIVRGARDAGAKPADERTGHSAAVLREMEEALTAARRANVRLRHSLRRIRVMGADTP